MIRVIDTKVCEINQWRSHFTISWRPCRHHSISSLHSLESCSHVQYVESDITKNERSCQFILYTDNPQSYRTLCVRFDLRRISHSAGHPTILKVIQPFFHVLYHSQSHSAFYLSSCQCTGSSVPSTGLSAIKQGIQAFHSVNQPFCRAVPTIHRDIRRKSSLEDADKVFKPIYCRH